MAEKCGVDALRPCVTLLHIHHKLTKLQTIHLEMHMCCYGRSLEDVAVAESWVNKWHARLTIHTYADTYRFPTSSNVTSQLTTGIDEI